MLDEDDVLALNILESRRGNGDCLLAEFRRKLNVGEHIRFQAQVLVCHLAAHLSGSCLWVEHITDVRYPACKDLIGYVSTRIAAF